jgi:hypothetical protein
MGNLLSPFFLKDTRNGFLFFLKCQVELKYRCIFLQKSLENKRFQGFFVKNTEGYQFNPIKYDFYLTQKYRK